VSQRIDLRPADLAAAFSESGLPFKTDVIDIRMVDPDFRERIAPGWMALPVRSG
jgi:hypothetical protein